MTSLIDRDQAVLDRYSRSTLPFSRRPMGVVRPTTTREIQDLVRLARTEGVSLYPLSRGKNWGYGDAMAPREGNLVVDLSDMNRIVEVNEELAYVVIEPGVSQGQLHAYLRERHPNLWMDANGAGPDASLVGNLLERGFGHTPMGDRSSLCAGMEVVLGTGEVISTGFGRFDNAHAKHTYRPGVGASLDGLFFQSNLGIVTRVGVWLQRRPEAFGAFFCRLENSAQMPALIDKLRELRLAGVVRSCVHAGNALRALTGSAPYPWDLTDGKAPVPETWVRENGKKRGIGAWNATGGVYGPKAVVDASLGVIRTALAEFSVFTLTDEDLPKMPPELRAAVVPAIGLLKGEPTPIYLRGAAWRSRADRGGFDPLENGAGLLWMVPTLPATGAHAARVEALVTEGFHRHGFDAPITLTFVNERTLLATTNVSYDRSSPQDTEDAWACYREMVPALLAAGYPPYRSGLGGYEAISPPGAHSTVLKDLKRALDPDGVLAPGRYERES